MDGRDSIRSQTFTRRAAIVGGLGGLVFTTLAGRLFSLQVIEGERYHRLAEDNRIDIRLVAPLRGIIYDRFGVEIATNRENYRLILIPEQTDDVTATLDKLARVVEISERQRRRIKREIERNRAFVPVTIVENLDWQTFSFLNANVFDFPGVQPDVGYTRIYPFPEELSHVVGFVGPVSEKEAEESKNPVLMIPGFRIGKDGIESHIEASLRGEAGSRHLEVNAGGRIIRELKYDQGKQGEDVVLSIDMGLQRFAADRVAGESAAVIVMDVQNGDVLALVSTPGFDSNLYNRGVDVETYRRWQNDPYQPLYNKATKGTFPPGSTFKMVVALAALDAGVIGINDHIFCNGAYRFGDTTFHCWRKEGHASVNLHKSIKESCDVYYYEVARRLGIERLAEMSFKLGFGTNYDFELPHTKAGIVPTKEWKQTRFKDNWHQADTIVAGIGQGYVTATPLQLAVMIARLVNGGDMIMPRLIRGRGGADLPPRSEGRLGVKAEYLQRIIEAMSGVVNEERGTALGSRLRGQGLSMGGKTGTAQVRRITKAERATGVVKNEDLPWEFRDHALFCGFGPVEAPRYSVSVLIEHGGGGSKAAAPVARDVLREALLRDPARQPVFVPTRRGPGVTASRS